ncbi:MAG: hypothetical protein ACKVP7_18985 [Hyphomicrobiaceae bacterium]
MTKITTLDEALALVRHLSPEKQALAVEFIEDLAGTNTPYLLDDAERSIISEGLARANRGEFATDGDIATAIDQSWN